MTIEEEIFQRTHRNVSRLEKYGFKRQGNVYQYSQNFMNDSFRADLTVDSRGVVSGRVYDLLMEEEYTNIRLQNKAFPFVQQVKTEYQKILNDIKNCCFDSDYFLFGQANRLAQYVVDRYGDVPEFLWKRYPGYGVFRNPDNRKWYAVMMNIDGARFGLETGELEMLNVKVDEQMIPDLMTKEGFYEAYHMNKKHWITIVLDDTLEDEQVIQLLDHSYRLVARSKKGLASR